MGTEKGLAQLMNESNAIELTCETLRPLGMHSSNPNWRAKHHFITESCKRKHEAKNFGIVSIGALDIDKQDLLFWQNLLQIAKTAFGSVKIVMGCVPKKIPSFT